MECNVELQISDLHKIEVCCGGMLHVYTCCMNPWLITNKLDMYALIIIEPKNVNYDLLNYENIQKIKPKWVIKFHRLS